MMRLSQGQLTLLSTCPRRFQHIYLDQLGSPTSFEQQEHQNWGTHFHLLMQQHELGLPMVQTVEDDRLYQCVQALVKTAPEVFERNVNFRQSEHRRTLEFEGYLLTVIYDLLILKDDSAQILDWKTYPRPENPHRLARNWQTRLYLFVLAETSDYSPEQISMIYWFVQAQSTPSAPIHPQNFKFHYSQALHEQTRQDLSSLLNQLRHWLQRYQEGEAFPQIEVAADRCGSCHFNLRCDRDEDPQATQPDPLLHFTDVQEVAL